MKETKFIDQNKEKWADFEKELRSKSKSPDKLSALFTEVTDDLSYAETYYTSRSVKVYLNGIAQRVFFNLYKKRKGKWGAVKAFFIHGLPQVMHQSRRDFRVSFLIFLVAVLIGGFSTAYDPDFPRIILGDRYVDMTLENIEKGEPMAIYGSGDSDISFLWITTNNIKVAFLTFVFGVLFSLGTCFFLIYNGIMVGAFQYFFIQQGLFKVSFLAIWLHGTIEISSIVLAGTAGIALGRGLLFPQTLKRSQAFQLSARRGIKIMAGIIPLFVIAGFIEGFLTRVSGASEFMSAAVIFLSFAFIVIYFVWYPWHKAKQGHFKTQQATDLPLSGTTRFDKSQIYSVGKLVAHTFDIYKKHFLKLLWLGLFMCGIYLVYLFGTAENLNSEYYEEDSFYSFFEQVLLYASFLLQQIIALFDYEISYFPLIFNWFLVGVVIFFATNVGLNTEVKKNSVSKMLLLAGFTSMLINLCLMPPHVFAFLLFFGVVPFITLWHFSASQNHGNIAAGFSFAFKILKGQYFKMLGLFSLTLVSCIIFLMLGSTFIVWAFYEMISWFANNANTSEMIYSIFTSIITIGSFCLVAPLPAIAIYLLFFSLKERYDAFYLKQKISQIKAKKIAYGMEAED